jgi:hypothetical protein
MTPEEVLACLLDLARDGGLRVRSVGAGEVSSHSGVCRLRDGVFVILVASDPLEDQIEHRYLPPAVRGRLDPGGNRLA